VRKRREAGEKIARERKEAQPFTETIKGVSFAMRFIPGGTYGMGDVMGDSQSNGETVHPATVANFHLAETVVTQALYEAVMNGNPSYLKGKDLPAEQVSWEGAQAFINELNSLTGRVYRLPTESEWEYAAREGGKGVRFGNG